MYIFNRLANYTDLELKRKNPVPLQLARNRYGRPTVKQLLHALSQEDAVGIIIGRNPLERLISAYRDKILSDYEHLSGRIITHYRQDGPVEEKQRKNKVPTFEEFISFIVDENAQGKALDMHWTPAYKFCNPCQVNLTHIIKFETFDRDTKAVLDQIGVSHLWEKLKTHTNKSRGQNTSAELHEEYFKKLSNDSLLDMQFFMQE